MAPKSASKKRPEKNTESTVGVYLRLRPIETEDLTLVKVGEQQVKTLPPDGSPEQYYSFTQVFDNVPQSAIFNKIAKPMVEDCLLAAKDGLIFTYGITGSGKTYTMEGVPNNPGLIYRTMDFVFNSIGNSSKIYPNLRSETTSSTVPSVIKWLHRTKETSSVDLDPNSTYQVSISLIELYNKQVHDLFEDFDPSCKSDRKRREIRTDERGMSYVANAVEIELKSANDFVEYYTRGIKRRKTGATALNQDSSRGHCVVTLKVTREYFEEKTGDLVQQTSQLCLVDLAGSERTKRSGATGGALHEAGNINNSLGALRKCIRALRDREPTNSIQYREYSLTRLFKSYFEGHGSINMVLCVKPTPEDFHENNIAMEFGLLTQDVAVDYATPPKMLKRMKNATACAYDLFDRKLPPFQPDPGMSDEEVLQCWLAHLVNKREKRRKVEEHFLLAQGEVRKSIIAKMDENSTLRERLDRKTAELKSRDEQLKLTESELNSTEGSKRAIDKKVRLLERQVRELDKKYEQAKKLARNFEVRHLRNEELYRSVLNMLENEQNRGENLKRTLAVLKKMQPVDWVNDVDPMRTSSPACKTTSTSETQSPLGTATSSSEESVPVSPTKSHRMSPSKILRLSPTKKPSTPTKLLQISPTKQFTTVPLKNGVPVANPRHNRSLSCSNLWIHHEPSGLIDTGTVMRPKLKYARSVKALNAKHILRKDAGGYSVVHQSADTDGEIETTVFKGQIVPTACGGAQVTFNDVETMRQTSPKPRRRAISDAHFTQ